jgi:hypothetical protein
MSRVQRVEEAFISVADALDADVDALVPAGRLVNHCTELTDADTAGLLLVDARGRLCTVASSDRRTEALDRLRAGTGEGPGVGSLRSGEPVRAPRLDTRTERRPQYAGLAEDVGAHGVYALPLTARDQPVGALNLLVSDTREIPVEDLTVAASPAGVAVGAMLRWWSEPLRPSDISTRIQIGDLLESGAGNSDRNARGERRPAPAADRQALSDRSCPTGTVRAVGQLEETPVASPARAFRGTTGRRWSFPGPEPDPSGMLPCRPAENAP